MTQPKQSLDDLLNTTVISLLKSALTVKQMRDELRSAHMEAYWQKARIAGEHLFIAGTAITDAHRILLGQMGIATQDGGGLVH